MTGTDPPLRTRSARTRRVVTALVVLGAAIVVAAIVGIVLSLDPVFSAKVIHGFNFNLVGPVRSPHRLQALGNARTAKVSVAAAGWLLITSVIALIGVGPLLLSLRHSLVGWRVGYLAAVFVPIIAFISFGPPRDAVFVPQELAAALLVFCVAGLRHSRAALWWMWALSTLPIWLWLGPGLALRFFAVAALLLVTIALDATGASQRARRALAVQFERTELEEARRAIFEERTRIAREMHDVVAHHMSLIAVQAETAPYRLAA